MGFPLGSWIMRKAMAPSVDVAGNILTGTRTSESRRLPDQTGMGAIVGYSGTYRTFLNLGWPRPATSEQRWIPFVLYGPLWRIAFDRQIIKGRNTMKRILLAFVIV